MSTAERPYRLIRDADDLRPWWARHRSAMRVHPELRLCVLFVGIKKNDTFLPRATGFVVIINDHGLEWTYLVTAQHVVSGLLSRGHEIYIRYNRKEGGTVVSGPIPGHVWFYHPTKEGELDTDVAVAPFRARDDELVGAIELNDTHSLAGTEDVLAKLNVGHGEEVAIIGLFRTHHGVGKIIPVVRTGNIAAMREEPIETKYCGPVDAYLVEAMSIAGLSGSPVFLHLAPWRVVGSEIQPLGTFNFWLIGLMHGHFDVKNLNEDVVTGADGQSLGSINAGLGVVIPVEKIIETINQQELAEMRKKKAQEAREQRGATADVDSDDSLPTDDNPNHREDFMRLQGVAARKQTQGD